MEVIIVAAEEFELAVRFNITCKAKGTKVIRTADKTKRVLMVDGVIQGSQGIGEMRFIIPVSDTLGHDLKKRPPGTMKHMFRYGGPPVKIDEPMEEPNYPLRDTRVNYAK